jgi:hypothetical protein
MSNRGINTVPMLGAYKLNFFFIPLSHYVGSVQHVFIMLLIDSAIIFTTGRLPDVNPP